MSALWEQISEAGRLMVFVRKSDEDTAEEDKEKTREIRLCGVYDEADQLATIVNLMHLAKWSGELHLNGADTRVQLYFRKGVFLAAHSDAARDRLGDVLVRMGLLTVEQAEEVIHHKEPSDRVGNSLVRKRMLTTNQVYDGLRRQAEDILLHAFEQGKGVFHLVVPLDASKLPALLHLDTQMALMDVLRRLDEESGRPAPKPAPPIESFDDAYDELELDEDLGGDSEDEDLDGGWNDEATGLRRRPPVPPGDLPADATIQIIKIYNTALARLFSTIDTDTHANLRRELVGFVHDETAPYKRIFHGVTVASNGTLDVDALVGNVERSGPDSITDLQKGLSELMFFVLFASGDAVDPTTQEVLERHVISALQKLPKPKSSDGQ